jgi:hypothetical protein
MCSSVVSSECAKVVYKFSLQAIPTRWEITVRVAMRPVRDVMILADVGRSSIVPAVRRMITQWLHSLFAAFIDHDRIVVATGGLHP